METERATPGAATIHPWWSTHLLPCALHGCGRLRLWRGQLDPARNGYREVRDDDIVPRFLAGRTKSECAKCSAECQRCETNPLQTSRVLSGIRFSHGNHGCRVLLLFQQLRQQSSLVSISVRKISTQTDAEHAYPDAPHPHLSGQKGSRHIKWQLGPNPDRSGSAHAASSGSARRDDSVESCLTDRQIHGLCLQA